MGSLAELIYPYPEEVGMVFGLLPRENEIAQYAGLFAHCARLQTEGNPVYWL
jgi:hypothetical protein